MRRKTNEQFIQQVKEAVGDEYTFLEPYVNERTKIKVRHNKCEYVWKVRPHDFLRKGKKATRCPYCLHRVNYTNETFTKAVDAVHGKGKYKVLTPFKTVGHYVRVQCLTCGYIFRAKGNSLIAGHGCPKCAKKLVADKERKTKEEYQRELNELYPNSFKIIGKYISCKKTIKVKHLVCGHTFEIQAYGLLKSGYCKYCNCSQGESIVRSILDKYNIDYKHGYVLPNRLHLDFYLPQYRVAIEYDGRQHYESNEFFDKRESLYVRQHRDQLKNQYCKEHNIKLLRIPYTYDSYKKVHQLMKDKLDFIK